jgi:hypothetical protein
LKILLLIILLLGLSGCKSSNQLYLDHVESITVIYSGHSKVYNAGTNEHEHTISWFKANKSGWKSYFATAAQTEILIKSTNFTLNIGEDYAILKYQFDGQFHQLIKPINAAAFDYMRN